jgi:hypothetical protein
MKTTTLKATTIPGLLRQMELAGHMSQVEAAGWMRSLMVPGLYKSTVEDLIATYGISDNSDALKGSYVLRTENKGVFSFL